MLKDNTKLVARQTREGFVARQNEQVLSSTIAALLFERYLKGAKYYSKGTVTDGELKYTPVYEPPTVTQVYEHLEGEYSLGAYLLDKNSMTSVIVWDVDLTPFNLTFARNITAEISDKLGKLPHVINNSGGKGFHVEVYLTKPVEGAKAKALGIAVRNAVGAPDSGPTHVEVYPKQDKLTKEKPRGNLIKLPLGVHQITGNQSFFVDRHNDWKPIRDEQCIKQLLSATVSFEELEAQVNASTSTKDKPVEEAVFELLHCYWGKGVRHELALALSGYLAKLGWTQEAVYSLVEQLTNFMGGDINNLRECVATTYAKHAKGERVEGYQGLRKQLPEDTMRELEQLLGSNLTGRGVTLEEVLTRLGEIKPGIEATELGEMIGYLPEEDRQALARAIKDKGAMDLPQAKALIVRCAKTLQKKLTKALSGDRPIIETKAQPLDVLRDEAIKAIDQATANHPAYPVLYRHSNELTRISKGENDKYAMQKLKPEALRGILADVALWVEKGTPTLPPKPVSDAVFHKGEWSFPVLEKVVNHPIFLPDGSLMTAQGYNPDIGYFYADYMRLGDTTPNTKNVQAAKQLIMDELLGDFRFTPNDSGASKAHVLSFFLLPYVFPLINDVTPLHLIDSPVPGSGKTKLVHVCTYPAEGRFVPGITAGRDNEEWRKSLTACLLEGRNCIFVDNMPTGQVIDSSALSSFLTQRDPGDRLLGQNTQLLLKNRSTWVLTGNNLLASVENIRRSAWIRLDPNMQRPQDRTDFKHKHLISWMQSQRTALVTAGITLIRAWVEEGMHPWTVKQKGSFDRWAEVMGGILQTIGVEGFMENEEALEREASGPEASMEIFCEAWFKHHKENIVTSDDLFVLASHSDAPAQTDGKESAMPTRGFGLLDERLTSKTEQGRKTKLGIILRESRDRVFNGYKIIKLTEKAQGGKTQWQLKNLLPNR